MKMGHCKIVAVSFIVMVELCSMAPVMACNYCPPALKPPPTVPVMSPPKAPKTPMVPPTTPMVPPTTPITPMVPPTTPATPMVPPTTPTTPMVPPIPATPMVPPTTPATPMVPPITPTMPPTSNTCPLDALKLGACADVLGGLVHLGLGDPSVNKCCPVLQGVLEIEAALCLCTTIKLKLLNLNIAIPLALELLAICGINPPPGFTCPTM